MSEGIHRVVPVYRVEVGVAKVIIFPASDLLGLLVSIDPNDVMKQQQQEREEEPQSHV